MVDRVISTHNLSIGTSIAIESIVKGSLPEYESDKPKAAMIDTSPYDSVWINVTTLYRNYYGAVDKFIKDNISPSEIAQDIKQEIEYIKDLLSQKNLKTIFYFCQYDRLANKHPKARLKTNITKAQIFNHELMLSTLSSLIRISPDIKIFKNELKCETKDNALIITHYAIDLLAEKTFGRLDLLESHTGVLKTKALWYTKLHSDKKNANIPLNRFTIQVFGDGQLFLPAERRLVDAVVETANKYEWNYLSTNERLFITLTLMPDKLILADLKELYMLN